MSCQGETVITITMLNESDGDGDQLPNKLAVLSRGKKGLWETAYALLSCSPRVEDTEHLDQNTI